MKRNTVSNHYKVRTNSNEGTSYTQRVLMTKEEFNFFKNEIKSIPDMAIEKFLKTCENQKMAWLETHEVLRSYLTLTTSRELAQHTGFNFDLKDANTYIEII